jgi:hypothetical protein
MVSTACKVLSATAVLGALVAITAATVSVLSW